MHTSSARVLGAEQGDVGQLGSIGVRFMVDSADSGGMFSLVEHPIPPRKLAAPLHRHSREDEYTFVLEGEIGVLLGDEVVFGGRGALIFKPRGQWHTFWNAGYEPARVLEIISPGGFEGYFEQLSDLLSEGSPPDPAKVAVIAERFGLELDPASIPRLTAELGVTFGRDAD
ncbi:MAG TPA: cupin domain-containing protein [Agromyces sp.]|jgi:mannose-6-phosphate isomerase-like protein (cupin superfamily)